MFGFDGFEVVIIFGLALVVLGPKKLPGLAVQVGRWLGRARVMARQFREQLEQEVGSVESALDVNKPFSSTPRSASPSASSSSPVGTPEPGTPEPATTAPASGSTDSPVSSSTSAPPGTAAAAETTPTHSALWTDPGMDELPPATPQAANGHTATAPVAATDSPAPFTEWHTHEDMPQPPASPKSATPPVDMGWHTHEDAPLHPESTPVRPAQEPTTTTTAPRVADARSEPQSVPDSASPDAPAPRAREPDSAR
jgi:sec-independent protein translocase protein TatB